MIKEYDDDDYVKGDTTLEHWLKRYPSCESFQNQTHTIDVCSREFIQRSEYTIGQRVFRRDGSRALLSKRRIGAESINLCWLGKGFLFRVQLVVSQSPFKQLYRRESKKQFLIEQIMYGYTVENHPGDTPFFITIYPSYTSSSPILSSSQGSRSRSSILVARVIGAPPCLPGCQGTLSLMCQGTITP